MPNSNRQPSIATPLPGVTRPAVAMLSPAVGRRIVEKVRFAAGSLVALAGALHLLLAGVEISVRHL